MKNWLAEQSTLTNADILAMIFPLALGIGVATYIIILLLRNLQEEEKKHS